MIFNKKKIITHDGSFHADDVFATAVLSILNKGKVKVIRTRDEKIIAKGDYVYDVGGVYNPELNRFDHHQKGGAGKRENGIEYSSFGLVWKKFGEEICGSEFVFKKVDEHLVQPIDAIDNGISICTPNIAGVFPCDISYIVSIFNPSFKETEAGSYEDFMKILIFAKNIILNEIKKSKDQEYVHEYISNLLKKERVDSKILILDEYISSRAEVYSELVGYKDILFIVMPVNKDFESWKLLALPKNVGSFENRKNLPSAWSGLRDVELQKVTGVSDAIFCHRALFLSGAKSKEGAIKLAQIALESN